MDRASPTLIWKGLKTGLGESGLVTVVDDPSCIHGTGDKKVKGALIRIGSTQSNFSEVGTGRLSVQFQHEPTDIPTRIHRGKERKVDQFKALRQRGRW